MKKIRDEIIKKKRSTPAEDLMIVIKPGEESTYKDVVDALDEMTINSIKRYALVDISEVEGQLVARSDGSANGAPAK
jgi:NAD kinase